MEKTIEKDLETLAENKNSKFINKKRIQSFDIARTFAILCVVLCHSVEYAYKDVNYMSLTPIYQIFRIIFFSIGRLGVPIFLFLTGALTLKKQIENDEDVLKFYKSSLLPLFITIEIWNILYNIFNYLITRKFDFIVLLQNLLFLKQVDMTSMWYMPMILGVYLAIPFICRIVKTFTIETIKFPMIIVFITNILLPSVNVVLYILKLQQSNIILNLSFMGRIIWIIFIIRILY